MSDTDFHRAIVESCPDALSCHTSSGAFVFASPAWAALVGRPIEELIGQTLEDIALPEDAAGVTRCREEAQTTWLVATLRYRVAHRERGPIWVETTLRAAPAEGATEARLVGSTRDVSAQTAAEQAIEARLESALLAEEHRDNLVAMIPGLVWYGPISPDLTRYHNTYMSDHLAMVTGYSSQEWIETPGFWASILHPEDRARAVKNAGLVWADRVPIPAYRVFAKDGRTLWLQSYMRIQHDAAGVPVRRHGLTLDITTNKQAEREIAELLQHQILLSQRVDEIISSIPGIVWETWHHEAGKSSLAMKRSQANFCSDYVETLTGYTAAEWAANPDAWLTLTPPEDREDVEEALERLIDEGGGLLQHRLRTKDRREIWLENHVVVGKNASGERLWMRGVALDITERKLAEQEREQMQQQLDAQSQRLSELSTPLIPVSDKIMVMPLIGTIDQARADYIMTSLLQGVSAAKAEVVIIDVTGVPRLDAESADALLRAAGAAQLLGTRVVLSGIRPDVAQTLISLGLDLSGIATRSSLASAFAEFSAPKPARRSKPKRRPALSPPRV